MVKEAPQRRPRTHAYFAAQTLLAMGTFVDRIQRAGGHMSEPSRKAVTKRTIAYWIFTLLVVFENAAGFLWTVLRIEYLRVMLAHLGYPQYFMNIVGGWQLAGAAALIAPGLPLVKEWAYAGATFTWIMASLSAYLSGDPVWPIPLVLLALLAVSYATRPASRRLAG